MEADPTTVRPNGELRPLLDRMIARGRELVVVTTPQGHPPEKGNPGPEIGETPRNLRRSFDP